MKITVLFCQAGLLLACLLFAGCGGEPYTYEPAHELKPGPGIFSGEDGEFTLIGSSKAKKEEKSEEGVEKVKKE